MVLLPEEEAVVKMMDGGSVHLSGSFPNEFFRFEREPLV